MKGFTDDIGMKFGLSKCPKATFRGKLEKPDHDQLDEETLIRTCKKNKIDP